jgi:transposase
MLGRNASQPALFQMVDLASLIPPDHRLRKLDAVLDLSFVREAVAECYSERGRPSIDPELFLRMLLLGKLYDLSDRELCTEIQMHVGMRWFCRLQLHDEVPDHSTLSKLKDKWAEAGIFEEVFDRVVRPCSEVGLVSGRHLSVDGTEVRANASMKSLSPREPKPQLAPDPDRGGFALSQEPQPKGSWSGHGVKYSNEKHRSTSDPDARLYRKGKGRETKLSYLMHDLIDTKSRVILRRKISHAHSSAERESALEMLTDVLQQQDALALPKTPEILSADAGYGTGEFAADVLDLGVVAHMPLQAAAAMEAVPTYQRRSFDLARQRQRREKVRRAKARNRVRQEQQTRGYQVSRRLRLRSEHVFAEGKTEHGLERARHRGRAMVQVQAELAGIVHNLKRLAAFLGRRKAPAAQAAQAAQRVPLTPFSCPRSAPTARRWSRRPRVLIAYPVLCPTLHRSRHTHSSTAF